MFLYRFDNNPELVHGWTTDKRRVSAELSRLRPRGGTAMYDAVAEAVPLVQSGKHRKKALVIISDGNDTSSRTAVVALQEQIRETEILVYAIGIDSQNTFQPRSGWGGSWKACMQRRPRPFPFPIPGRRPSPPPPTNPGGTRFPGNPPPIVIPPSGSAHAWSASAMASTSPRCATSPTTAADAPKSFARLAISIRRRPTSPTNCRSSTTSGTRRADPRTAAGTRSVSKSRAQLHGPRTQGIHRDTVAADRIAASDIIPCVQSYAAAIGLSVVGSLGGLLAASSFLLLGDGLRVKLVPAAISYAVGTLLGAALLALLPQALEKLPPATALGTLLAGVLTFFMLERVPVVAALPRRRMSARCTPAPRPRWSSSAMLFTRSSMAR